MFVRLAWKPAAGVKDWIVKPEAVKLQQLLADLVSLHARMRAGRPPPQAWCVGAGFQWKKQSWRVSDLILGERRWAAAPAALPGPTGSWPGS